MTKRDNELTRTELIEKRARQLLEHFDMHRGQLPEPLLIGFTGLRDAINKPSDEDAVKINAEQDAKLTAETAKVPSPAEIDKRFAENKPKPAAGQ